VSQFPLTDPFRAEDRRPGLWPPEGQLTPPPGPRHARPRRANRPGHDARLNRTSSLVSPWRKKPGKSKGWLRSSAGWPLPCWLP